MKYLELYEKKWNEDKLTKFINEKEDLCELLKQFLILYKSQSITDENYENIYVIDFQIDEIPNDSGTLTNKYLTLTIMYPEQMDKTDYIPLELENVSLFLEDPKRYKDSLKYNI